MAAPRPCDRDSSCDMSLESNQFSSSDALFTPPPCRPRTPSIWVVHVPNHPFIQEVRVSKNEKIPAENFVEFRAIRAKVPQQVIQSGECALGEVRDFYGTSNCSLHFERDQGAGLREQLVESIGTVDLRIKALVQKKIQESPQS